MTLEHTPGPWETELITERTRGGARQYWTIFTRGKTSRTLATVHPYGIVAIGQREDLIAEADARLMALAPLMYRVCCAAAAYRDAIEDNDGLNHHAYAEIVGRVETELDEALEVLAKAKSGTFFVEKR